jgi:hypothetical protein
MIFRITDWRTNTAHLEQKKGYKYKIRSSGLDRALVIVNKPPITVSYIELVKLCRTKGEVVEYTI